ncbi:hypothetical protein HC891_04410 [Candidatus Gracilibacteria bacterium]|nr:hypothetical protein [Candidatus Gracilibacteria bacterium]
MLPLAVALLLRWLLPALLPQLSVVFDIDLMALAPQLKMTVVLTLTPLLYGQVIGFLLLDQRDEGTLVALRVTPLPPWHFLAYRLALPSALSFGITPLALLLAGGHTISLTQSLLATFAAVPIAPCFALALAALAANKVQGMALMKMSGVLMAAPLAMPFVAMPYQLLLGIAPTYWPVRFAEALLSGEPLAWLYCAGAWVYCTSLAGALLRLEAARTPQLG